MTPCDGDYDCDEVITELDCDDQDPSDSALSGDCDQDNSAREVDCDDQNAAVYPGAEEICDGRDNNCDGFADPESLCGPTSLTILDGYDGAIYRSVDSGITWVRATSAPIQTPAKVALYRRRDDNAYLATSTTGAIYISQDQAQTWQYFAEGPWGRDSPNDTPSQAVDMDGNDQHIYVISTSSIRTGILYVSDDQGSTWSIATTWPETTGMDTALAVDHYGNILISHTPYEGAMIYRSTDDGDTLQLQGNFTESSGPIANLTIDAVGRVYSSADPETSFHVSEDLGMSWLPTGSWRSPRGIATLSSKASALYAASVKGNVIKSEDRGLTWMEVGNWGDAALPDRTILSASGWIDMITE